MGGLRVAALVLGLAILLVPPALVVGEAVILPQLGPESDLRQTSLIVMFIVLIVGILAGAFLAAAFLWVPVEARTLSALVQAATLILVILFFGVIMVLEATAAKGSMAPVRAGLVFLCGSLALLAAVRTFGLLREGQDIEFSSHWGGLGGGLGGWRVSSTATFAALAITFSSATLAVALITPAEPGGRRGTNQISGNDSAAVDSNSANTAGGTESEVAGNESSGGNTTASNDMAAAASNAGNVQ